MMTTENATPEALAVQITEYLAGRSSLFINNTLHGVAATEDTEYTEFHRMWTMVDAYKIAKADAEASAAICAPSKINLFFTNISRRKPTVSTVGGIRVLTL